MTLVSKAKFMTGDRCSSLVTENDVRWLEETFKLAQGMTTNNELNFYIIGLTLRFNSWPKGTTPT